MPMYGTGDYEHFYPRSPCGERRLQAHQGQKAQDISIHALLAESDPTFIVYSIIDKCISIHALLAESDVEIFPDFTHLPDFYPRSPCGERPGPVRLWKRGYKISIHALLAESDGSIRPHRLGRGDFYPRSPCGERLATASPILIFVEFLSTLSLRRATHCAAAPPGV